MYIRLLAGLKGIWKSYDFIFFRLALMFFAYRYFSVGHFDVIEELALAFGFMVITVIVFIIADALSFRGGEMLFMLPDTIKKSIARDILIYTKVPEQRGLFISTPRFTNNIFQYEYAPISNADQVYYKATAYINVLHNLHTPDANEMIDKIRDLQKEAEYMMQNIHDIPTIIKNAH